MFIIVWGFVMGAVLSEAGLNIIDNPIWFLAVSIPLVMVCVNVQALFKQGRKQ
jgi:hypothetical protein